MIVKIRTHTFVQNAVVEAGKTGIITFAFTEDACAIVDESNHFIQFYARFLKGSHFNITA